MLFIRFFLIVLFGMFFIFSFVEGKKQTVGDVLQNINKKSRGSERKQSQWGKNTVDLPKVQEKIKKTTTSSQNNITKSKPTVSKFMDVKDFDELEKVTDQGIKELLRLMKKFRNSSDRGNFWLKLGEMYFEKAQIIEYRRQQIYDQQLELYLNKKRKRKPYLNLKPAHIYYYKAIDLYDRYIKAYPKSSKVDQALYLIGHNYFKIGKKSRGEKYFVQLSKKYPRSPYVTEANFVLGEYYFEKERWSQALPYYVKVLKRKRTHLYEFALYKFAWCLFRLGKVNQAVHNMEKLIVKSRASSKTKSPKLVTEALDDSVIFFAQSKDYKRGISFYRRNVGSKYSSKYIEKLAYLCADRGNRKTAKMMLKELITQNPTHPKAFEYQHKIVEMYMFAIQSKTFREELLYWNSNFQPGTRWYEANDKNKKFVKKTDEIREKIFRNYVLRQHKTSKDTKSQYSHKLAYQGYKMYLKFFPNVPEAIEMRFFYAEILFDLKKYKEASRQYKIVSRQGTKSKYGALAAFNLLLSLEKKLPSEELIQKRVGKKTTQFPFDENTRSFVDESNWYITNYPKSEKYLEIKFRIGRLHYLHNHFDESIKIFRNIIKESPKSEYAKYSANLILDIYNLKKDYVGLQKVGVELLAIPGFSKSNVGKDIQNIIEEASFKNAQRLEKSGDFAKSADYYAAYAKSNPRSSLVTVSHYNAGVNYERSHNLLPAITMYEAVTRDKNPKYKKINQKALQRLAIIYGDIGNYTKSALAYQNLARQDKNDPLVADYYFNAAIIWDGRNSISQAEQNYLNFFRHNSKNEKFKAYYKIASMMRKNNRINDALKYYRLLLNSPYNNREDMIEAHFYIVNLYKKIGELGKSIYWENNALEYYNKYGRGLKGLSKFYISKINLQRIYRDYDKLQRIHIPANPKKQQSIVQKKLAMLNDISAKLTKVIRYDDPYGIVGSLTLLGMTNNHIVKSFLSAPEPKGLNKEERNEYRKGVENLIAPFRAKAKDSFRSAIEKALEFDTYDQWFNMAKNGIREYDNEFFPYTGEKTFMVVEEDWMGMR